MGVKDSEGKRQQWCGDDDDNNVTLYPLTVK